MLSLLFIVLAAILASLVVTALTGAGVILAALLFSTISMLIEGVLNDILNKIKAICYLILSIQRYDA